MMLMKKVLHIVQKAVRVRPPDISLIFLIVMKKILFALLVLLISLSPCSYAADSVAEKAVKARANVLASALEMLALDGSDRYPETLAGGIEELVRQMKQVEYIIDSLDENAVEEAEAELAQSANFNKLKSDFRSAVRLLAVHRFYNCENLESALEDLEDEICDME